MCRFCRFAGTDLAVLEATNGVSFGDGAEWKDARNDECFKFAADGDALASMLGDHERSGSAKVSAAPRSSTHKRRPRPVRVAR